MDKLSFRSIVNEISLLVKEALRGVIECFRKNFIFAGGFEEISNNCG